LIDLRGNEGGTGVGESLIAHLVQTPTPVSIATRSVRYRRVPDALRTALSTWDDSFYDWGDAAVGPVDGFYRLTKYDDAEAGVVIAPKAPRFGGQVWVMIGPDNSSATFEFAETVQQQRLGTLVGEPTGGNQRGINGGAFLFMTLPGSGIELDVPLIAQFPEKNVPDAGLMPDVPAAESAGSIAAGRDIALEAILARIDESDSAENH
jgi:C-terminal processing protease CtpA/Prc